MMNSPQSCSAANEGADIIGVLRSVHSALDGALGDSDVTHIENDDELREEHPVQWAAQWLAHAIELLGKTRTGVVAQACVMREALERIAKQQLVEERLVEGGDYEYGYEQIVKLARAALAAQPPAAPVETGLAVNGPGVAERLGEFIDDAISGAINILSDPHGAADFNGDAEAALQQTISDALQALSGIKPHSPCSAGNASKPWPNGVNDIVKFVAMLTRAEQYDIAFKIAENIGHALTRDEPQTVQVASDESHPDCATAREVELYDALMGFSSAVSSRTIGGYRNWMQGGVKIWPIVENALRLSSPITRPERGVGK